MPAPGSHPRSISRFVNVGSRIINLEQITTIKTSDSGRLVGVFFGSGSYCEITPEERDHILKYLDFADEER